MFKINDGGLAQLARASRWQREGHRFEPGILHLFLILSVSRIHLVLKFPVLLAPAFCILLIHVLICLGSFRRDLGAKNTVTIGVCL